MKVNKKLGRNEAEEKYGEREVANLEDCEPGIKAMCKEVRSLVKARDKKLKTYSLALETFKDYIKHTVGTKEWLTFFPEEELKTSGTLDAIAYLKNYKIYIWKKSYRLSKKKIALTLLHETKDLAPVLEILHLLFTPEPGHFDRLKIIKSADSLH